MKRKGFTLVELLVVIAIIALLISILAPSLKSAKDLVRQMMCMTNQKSLGMAVILYSEGNSGRIMPGYWFTSENQPSNPDGLVLAFGDSALAADGYLGTGARHTIGWAYVLQVWRPESLLYCPSLATTAGPGRMWFDYRNYPTPWGTKPAPTTGVDFGTAYVRITYMYYPHTDGQRWLYSLQLSTWPSDKPMLCDAFYNRGFCGHTMSGTQWFMVYPAGHVLPRTSGDVLKLYDAGVNAYAGPNWPDYVRLYEALFK